MFSPSSADPAAAFQAAQRNWYRLYRTQDWMTDPVKRRRMLAARIAYQDAKLRLFVAATSAESVDEVPGTGADAAH